MKNKFTALLLVSAFFVPLGAMAEPFTLSYKNNNRWVAKEDAKPLRDLVKEAKSKKQQRFTAILPEGKRDISIERLVVVRDILEKQTKQGVIIEEIKGSAEENSLTIGFKK